MGRATRLHTAPNPAKRQTGPLTRSCARLGPNFLTLPAPHPITGIYAGVSQRQPNLVWIELDPKGLSGKYGRPKIDHLLMVPEETQKNGRTLRHIRGNSICGRNKNDHVIEMWMQDDFIVDPPSNGALNAVDGHAWTSWCGPLIVMSKAPVEESDPKTYIDVDLNDFVTSLIMSSTIVRDSGAPAKE